MISKAKQKHKKRKQLKGDINLSISYLQEIFDSLERGAFPHSKAFRNRAGILCDQIDQLHSELFSEIGSFDIDLMDALQELYDKITKRNFDKATVKNLIHDIVRDSPTITTQQVRRMCLSKEQIQAKSTINGHFRTTSGPLISAAEAVGTLLRLSPGTMMKRWKDRKQIWAETKSATHSEEDHYRLTKRI